MFLTHSLNILLWRDKKAKKDSHQLTETFFVLQYHTHVSQVPFMAFSLSFKRLFNKELVAFITR